MSSTGYLGVDLSSDLKWNKHVHKLASKGMRTLGVLRRNLRTCPREVKDLACRSLLRPKLEYASCVWDPYTKDNIRVIEHVQWHAARFVTNTYTETSVTALLNSLHWPSLEQRRAESRLCMLHRIMYDKVDVDKSKLFTNRLPKVPRITRRSHSLKIHKESVTKDCYKFSFVPRTIIQWNNLPRDTIIVSDTSQFRNHLVDIDLKLGGPSYSY